MGLLCLKDLTKTFGGLTAVHHVSFDVEPNKVVGLIGPNGAGKTTIFNLITGIPSNSWRNHLQANSDFGTSTHRIVSLGIPRTSKPSGSFRISLFGKCTLRVGHCRMKSGIISSMFHTPGQQKEEQSGLFRSLETLEFAGLNLRPSNWQKTSLMEINGFLKWPGHSSLNPIC